MLESLSDKDDITLGIASGNIEEGAQVKLQHSRLDSYFKFGAFGSDSENREELIRIAIQSGSRLYNEGRNYSEVFVIGDTPMDIIHGRAAGAGVLSVATGSYSLGELQKYNPDYSIENFNDIKFVVNIFTN
ncbi:MAG: HAD hydrolase-like protein [Thermodesulfobacteriota bacterium]